MRRLLLPLLLAAGLLPFQAAPAQAQGGSVYFPTTPTRILDTRTSLGGHRAPLGPGQVLTLRVVGAAVPAAATAVVLNATATDPTLASYLTIWPAGQPRPLASDVNFIRGQTVPNMVTVALGAQGSISIYNQLGHVNVVVDLSGYYAPSPGGDLGLFRPLSPARVLDTRTPLGGHLGQLGPGQTLTMRLAGAGNVPLTGAEAVVMNVTVTRPSAASYLTVFPAGQARPLASSLNWVQGENAANRVTATLGTGGDVTFYNAKGTVDLVIDINGYYYDGAAAGVGAEFFPLAPTRVLDTRGGRGGRDAPIPAGGSISTTVTGGTVPAQAWAVALNATVTNPRPGGYLTIYPGDDWLPPTSDLNFGPWITRANFDLVRLAPDGTVNLHAEASTTDVALDVGGYFGPAPGSSSPPAAPQITSAAVGARGQVDLAWSAPSSASQIVAYTVEASGGAGVWPLYPGSTSVGLEGLACGSPHTFTVAATNADGTGPASPPTAPLTVPCPVRPPYRIGFVGASVTTGWFATTVAQAYPQQVAVILARRSLAVTPLVVAIPGATASDALNWNLPSGQNAVVVQLATHEFWNAVPLATYRQTYSMLLDRLRSRNPSLSLVCTGVWGNGSNQRHVPASDYDSVAQSVCTSRGGRFVGLEDIFGRIDVHQSGRHTVFGVSDWFHPNDLGHLLIAQRVAAAIP